ncbi:hypothetical protein EG68_04543 [Paragonimus skrjabini miyazakii]|uniref:Uncharacterized protein n=1 Tax=Paragonimus skrjabini miyazakii TaxID=59628 RepID=A0A8S9Z0Z4_9TREM|nr:hypothetical protein EG68_04543 [Paragonimus skrjabini miyazakii]
MLSLNGKPVRRHHSSGCGGGGGGCGSSGSGGGCGSSGSGGGGGFNSGSCCGQNVCAGDKDKNVEIKLDASENVYVMDKKGTLTGSTGGSGSCNTQIVASDDAIVISGVGGRCGCAVESNKTDDCHKTTQGVVVPTIEYTDEPYTEETSPPYTIATDPPRRTTTTSKCDKDVIIIGIIDGVGGYPPIFAPPCLPVPISMYQLRNKLDIVFGALVYDIPFAAGAYQILSVAQSLSISQNYQISVLINGGFCYQFLMSGIPTNTGLPCKITDITQMTCPHQVFPSCNMPF